MKKNADIYSPRCKNEQTPSKTQHSGDGTRIFFTNGHSFLALR